MAENSDKYEITFPKPSKKKIPWYQTAWVALWL